MRATRPADMQGVERVPHLSCEAAGLRPLAVLYGARDYVVLAPPSSPILGSGPLHPVVADAAERAGLVGATRVSVFTEAMDARGPRLVTRPGMQSVLPQTPKSRHCSFTDPLRSIGVVGP